MKYLQLVLIAIIFFSCGQRPSENERPTAQNEIIDDTTLFNNKIVEYYKKEFQKTKSNEPQSQLKIDTTEDGIELKVISDTNLVFAQLNTIPFSKHFIKGDLNGDKVDDILIPVYSTGGGTAEWQEIFLFTSKNDKVDFLKMYSSFDLGHCQKEGSHEGQFYPEKIDNGILIGESYCYKPEDAHCCPSFKFTTQYKFDNGLTFLNQTKKE